MIFQSNLLNDQVALVTGATRGIGQGILLALAKTGATVIGTATTKEGAEKISLLLKERGYRGQGVVMNVTSISSIEDVVTTIKSQYGCVSILVNNAAITRDNLYLRMKEEEWLEVMETNLHSVFRVSKACIRDMVKMRFGRIINIGSVVGSTGNPGQVNYCASKAGLLGFTKALALELGSRDITVNTIAPGFIATDMTNALSDEQKESIFKRIPMQRLGQIEDIANAVIFLVSAAGSYITGQTLHINGGMFLN